MSDERITHGPHDVFLLSSSGEWKRIANTFASRVSFVSSPSIGSATLFREYGKILHREAVKYIDVPPITLADKIVKIKYGDKWEWHGVIVAENTSIDGGTKRKSGTQRFVARTMDHILARHSINTAFVQEGEYRTKEIDRPVGFNLGAGRDSDSRGKANCIDVIRRNTPPVFAEKLALAEMWTSFDIIKYLIDYASKKTSQKWEFEEHELGENLSLETPILNINGLTILDALNAILNRRKMRGFYIEPRPDGRAFVVHGFSFSDREIRVPSGALIPKNERVRRIEQGHRPAVQSLTITKDTSHKHDRVKVVGDPVGYCMTIFYESGLAAGWTDEERTAYNNGASESSDYSAMDQREKWNANQTARRAGNLSHVFRDFIISPDFDGKLNGFIAMPDPDDESKVVTFWHDALRVADRIPYYNSKGEQSRPFALIDIDGEYTRLDKMSVGKTKGNPLLHWSSSLLPLDDQPGISLAITGKQQHVIAGDDDDGFLGVDDADKADPTGQVVAAWKYMPVTLTLEADARVSAVWPDDKSSRKGGRTLTIYTPGLRLDYVAAETITGLDAIDGAQKTKKLAIVKDDRKTMRDIARIAYEWYATPRVAISMSVLSLGVFAKIGDLIESVDGVGNVNSIVTAVAYDLDSGSCVISTNFSELDLQVF